MSVSHAVAAALAKKIGSPPTPPKARAGELTPPGISLPGPFKRGTAGGASIGMGFVGWAVGGGHGVSWFQVSLKRVFLNQVW
jgi:hypothetical protein